MDANVESPHPARSRWFWLPAGTTAVLASPVISVADLYVLSSAPSLALAVGVTGSAALTWSVARWQLARRYEAAGFAAIAGGVAVWAQFAAWSGVS